MSRPRGSKSLFIALLALVAIAIVAAAGLSGNFSLSGQQTYPTATVSGRVIGKAFTEGNAVGNVTTIFFGPTNNSSQKGLPANIKSDGSYSIILSNGMNYTVYMYVINPNNDEDTAVCQGQTVFLTNIHQATYVFDIFPVNCA
jgi:hypothetical protein